jgi:hypothetical protein
MKVVVATAHRAVRALNWRPWFAISIAALYTLSLVLPAAVFSHLIDLPVEPPQQDRVLQGRELLVNWGIAALCPALWFVNPLVWLGWLFLLRRYDGVATALGLTAWLFSWLGMLQPVNVLNGYYVWMGSAVMLFVAGLICQRQHDSRKLVNSPKKGQSE